MRLANLTWPKAQEYFEKNDMVLISIGSIECHGRHMPLGTDTLIPDHLLEMIEQKSDVLIAPTIPYGACQSLAPYPGTIDIDNEVLYQFCRQIFLSLYRHGARKFVFLNGHGGNMKMIERLGLEFEDKGCLVAMLNWWLMAWDMNPAWKGGHGGGEETAAILGIDPSLVDKSEIGGELQFKHLSDNLKTTGFRSVQYKGVTVESSAARRMLPTAAGSALTIPTPLRKNGARKCLKPQPTISLTLWKSSRKLSFRKEVLQWIKKRRWK